MPALSSFSKLPRAMKCVASNVLAHVDEGDDAPAARGTSVHDFLRDAAGEHGRDKALELLQERGEPPEVVWLCEAIDVDAMPWRSFDKTYVEVGFILNVLTGKVRFMGERCTHDNLRGRVGDDEVGGVLDLVGVDAVEGIAYVYDYKTGRIWNDPHTSWQLLAGAVAVAAWAKVETVHAEFIHVRDGNVYRRGADFDLLDLDTARMKMQHQALRVKAARRDLQFGTPPPATMGDHCDYCPSRRYCPAIFGHLKALVKAEPDVEQFGPVLAKRNGKWEIDLTGFTPEQLGEAYAVYAEKARAIEMAGKAFEAFARKTPIPLGGRRVLALAEGVPRDRVVDPARAVPLLRELLGDETAERACTIEVDTSKSAITEAVKAKLMAEKGTSRGASKVADEVFARLRDEGVLRKVAPAPRVREIELPPEE